MYEEIRQDHWTCDVCGTEVTTQFGLPENWLHYMVDPPTECEICDSCLSKALEKNIGHLSPNNYHFVWDLPVPNWRPKN